ncbi:hypothetical protein LOTGIDRAFT_160535 [Lottia gigantea]|uniref:CCHC-type domain-containing protein n=1 Tax=Lottia gigantea TaxID=225164 RepID=V4AEW2_LOTGI|nr:hypothetical protein LOTGIDRAFT_160535 [Lottia gigantea]ESO95397.1 hypothetical protein LOTGIDRAFT_160535 [Lottia gigantea]
MEKTSKICITSSDIDESIVKRNVKVTVTRPGNMLTGREMVFFAVQSALKVKYNSAIEALWKLDRTEEWFVTVSKQEFVEKLLAVKQIKMNEVTFSFTDADKRIMNIRAHWIPPYVSNNFIEKVFAEYGNVINVVEEQYGARHTLCGTKSGLRRISLECSPEQYGSVPHIINIDGVRPFRMLLACTDRPPLCLHCRNVGHMARECPSKIRRTVETEKVKSYADALSGFSGPGDDAIQQVPEAEGMDAKEITVEKGEAPSHLFSPDPVGDWAEEMDSEDSSSSSESESEQRLIMDVKRTEPTTGKKTTKIRGSPTFIRSVSTSKFVCLFWQGTPNFAHNSVWISERYLFWWAMFVYRLVVQFLWRIVRNWVVALSLGEIDLNVWHVIFNDIPQKKGKVIHDIILLVVALARRHIWTSRCDAKFKNKTVSSSGAIEALWKLDKTEEWFVTLSTREHVDKLLTAKSVKMQNITFIFSDANKRIMNIRAHWIPPFVSDSFIGKVFDQYGTVVSVLQEEYGPRHVLNGTKSGLRRINLECSDAQYYSVPHIVMVPGVRPFRILVACSDRQPLCLYCKQTGHMARDCPSKTRRIETQKAEPEAKVSYADAVNNVTTGEDAICDAPAEQITIDEECGKSEKPSHLFSPDPVTSWAEEMVSESDSDSDSDSAGSDKLIIDTMKGTEGEWKKVKKSSRASGSPSKGGGKKPKI